MKKTLFYTAIIFAVIAAACGGNSNPKTNDDASAKTETTPSGNPSYDPKRGEGKFTEVQVSPSLDTKMAESGTNVYKLKCESCHKLTDEKLVGPGWKGITERHNAVWIMNFVTNTDAMIDKDPYVQSQLELCLVRMPNQNLTDDEARSVYEFMRKNDGVK